MDQYQSTIKNTPAMIEVRVLWWTGLWIEKKLDVQHLGNPDGKKNTSTGSLAAKFSRRTNFIRLSFGLGSLQAPLCERKT